MDAPREGAFRSDAHTDTYPSISCWASQMRVFIILSLLLAACASGPSSPLPKSGPIPEARHSTIGYATVNEALTALRSKPGTEFRDTRGWTVVKDREGTTQVLWSFTPEDHPAHPAVAKREVFEKDGAVWLNLKVHCEASKAACDQFVRDFDALNQKVREDVRREQK